MLSPFFGGLPVDDAATAPPWRWPYRPAASLRGARVRVLGSACDELKGSDSRWFNDHQQPMSAGRSLGLSLCSRDFAQGLQVVDHPPCIACGRLPLIRRTSARGVQEACFQTARFDRCESPGQMVREPWLATEDPREESAAGLTGVTFATLRLRDAPEHLLDVPTAAGPTDLAAFPATNRSTHL